MWVCHATPRYFAYRAPNFQGLIYDPHVRVVSVFFEIHSAITYVYVRYYARIRTLLRAVVRNARRATVDNVMRKFSSLSKVPSYEAKRRVAWPRSSSTWHRKERATTHYWITNCCYTKSAKSRINTYRCDKGNYEDMREMVTSRNWNEHFRDKSTE